MKRSLCPLLIVAALGPLACDERAPAAETPALSPAPPAATSAPQPRAPATPERVDFLEQAMGTEVRMVTYTAPGTSAAAVRAAMAAAFAEIRRLEALMSSWRDDSEVARINASGGRPVPVSAETFRVLEKSLWMSRLSNGAFDVTFKALSDAWKFGDAADAVPASPSPDLVAARRRLVDYRKLHLDPGARTVRIEPGMKVGLGGIAKGYIVDRAAAVLRRRGMSSFLVQAGGDLYGAGQKPDGSSWVSGIQDPRGNREDYFAVIELRDRAFSTAGDYARSYVVDGKRYHHIIDPRTGYPATACRSVTVWAKDAFTADAVDDAVFILGPEKGLELINSLDGVGAVIVDAQNEVWVSPRLREKVRILRPPTDGT